MGLRNSYIRRDDDDDLGLSSIPGMRRNYKTRTVGSTNSVLCDPKELEIPFLTAIKMVRLLPLAKCYLVADV